MLVGYGTLLETLGALGDKVSTLHQKVVLYSFRVKNIIFNIYLYFDCLGFE